MNNNIISNIVGTNVTDAATTASGLVVNDPMGLCMVAEGTLQSSTNNHTTMNSDEAYNSNIRSNNTIHNDNNNSNNDSGIYTNIIQLAQKLLFPSSHQQPKPSINSGSSSTTPTATSTTNTGTDDSSPNKQQDNPTKQKKNIIVVTIEMDDSTIFVSNYSTNHIHDDDDEYTVAIQLPNTISEDVMTTLLPSQQQQQQPQVSSTINNDETTNTLLSKDDDNNNSIETELTNEGSVQMIGTMSTTTITPMESMTLDSTSTTLDQTTTTNTTNTVVATTASIMNMDHVE